MVRSLRSLILLFLIQIILYPNSRLSAIIQKRREVIEPDQAGLTSVVISDNSNDPLLELPEFKSFYFDDPSFPRPPSEPPDVEICLHFEPDAPVIDNFNELNDDQRGGEINVEDDDSFTFVTRTFLPFLTYPKISSLVSSARNEDTIFDTKFNMSRANPQATIVFEEQLVPHANTLVIKKNNQRVASDSDITDTMLRFVMPLPNTKTPYIKLPIENEILGFLKILGYDEDLKAKMTSLSTFVATRLRQPWRAILSVLNRSLTGKDSSSDTETSNTS
ncbi:hypothetical protein Tco_1028516 [Tanacetum coccineum]|uniref:Uncharacterized protein n=1 Tax=Tanacetum coccineum TaxID=301880 RepID=A0ABQ5G0T1_9ASTR